MKHYDIIVIGAGPAGMAAANTASQHGASVLVLDEQATPGGQIYRSIEANQSASRPELGETYLAGAPLAKAFRGSNIQYEPGATVWQLGQDRQVGYSKDGAARMVTASEVIIATGAQERPLPVAGWTLPGVMTVGAAQILLKESALGVENAVFAGTGPLLYLVVHQYLEAGIPIKAVIDLTPKGNYLRAVRHSLGAISGFSKIYEGWRWKQDITKSGVPLIEGVVDLKVIGTDNVTGIRYKKGNTWQQIDCENVLLHQGVVPNLNLMLAAGCDSHWSEAQACWNIDVDAWFQSSLAGISVAGDGASIGGAVAAEQRGALTALGALIRLRKISTKTRDSLSAPIRKTLDGEMRVRPFLDALFRPADIFRAPVDDDVVVCRCEEVTAGQIRETVDIGCNGPNQLKSYTRCGMGPCQGRFCGLTASEIIADKLGVSVSEVGYYRLRPPIKPISLCELAAMADQSEG